MMRVLFAAALTLATVTVSGAQEVVDRIVARVENDIILLSDLQALARYQELLDGKSESDAQLLDRLIDQWIVRTEADVAHFPPPSEAEIERGLDRLKKSFPSPEEFEERKIKDRLSDADIRRMTISQLYLSNYLDSRFRPSVQIDEKQIEDFYQTAVVPRAKARGEEPPALDAARDAIQEALVQQGINEQADRWLKESRARLHVEKLLDQGTR
jgi:hypothetical protein